MTKIEISLIVLSFCVLVISGICIYLLIKISNVIKKSVTMAQSICTLQKYEILRLGIGNNIRKE